MEWFNLYGLIIIIIIMLPNAVFAVSTKDGFVNRYESKTAEIFEQIGRYGVMILMIINVPHTYFGYFFEGAKAVYLAVNGILCAIYLMFWIICKSSGVFRSIALSVTPSLIFTFSGVMLLYVPLILLSIIFASAHILISYKNARIEEKERMEEKA